MKKTRIVLSFLMSVVLLFTSCAQIDGLKKTDDFSKGTTTVYSGEINSTNENAVPEKDFTADEDTEYADSEAKAEEEAKAKAEAEAKAKAEEEARKKAEEEARKKAEEETKARAEAEAKAKAEEEARKKAEEEAKAKAEAEAKAKAEEEARKKAEEEAKNKEKEQTKSASEPEYYVLNTNSKKFHRPDCGSVAQIKEKNYAESRESREEIIKKGYDPCKRCNP